MQEFTGAGVFLTKWGSFGAGEGQLNLPYAVRAGANGIVYVSDSSNFRVQKFSFSPPAIPTMPGWGIVVMTLFMLVVGSIVGGNRTTLGGGPDAKVPEAPLRHRKSL